MNMAYILMTNTVMAYMVMADIVMSGLPRGDVLDEYDVLSLQQWPIGFQLPPPPPPPPRGPVGPRARCRNPRSSGSCLFWWSVAPRPRGAELARWCKKTSQLPPAQRAAATRQK